MVDDEDHDRQAADEVERDVAAAAARARLRRERLLLRAPRRGEDGRLGDGGATAQGMDLGQGNSGGKVGLRAIPTIAVGHAARDHSATALRVP